jgi:hypothetical protein
MRRIPLNHFAFFGLKQVWRPLIGRSYLEIRFMTPGPYRVCRG